jgi:hypothetical protein
MPPAASISAFVGQGFVKKGWTDQPGIKKDQIRSNKIYWFLPVWFPLFESFRRQALEGVQKDVRRTVSVMQYNILAS